MACHPLVWHHGLVKWSLLPHGVYSYLKGTKPSIITQTKCLLSWQHAKEMSCGWTHHLDAEDQERNVIFMSKWCRALVFLQLMTAMHSSGDSQATFIIRFMSVSNNHFSTSELYSPALLLYWLLAQVWAHRPHTGLWQYWGAKPLFQIASTQSSVVQGREGTYCPLRTLPHSFEEQPSLIINRHTKRWAPNNTEQIPLCVQVLNISATTVCPPALPLLFRYLHIKWKMWRTQKIFSTFLFSLFCETGQF